MIVKRIFNYFFSEESKQNLREKYSNIFEYYDRILYYKRYLNAYKKISKNIIFHTEKPYGYRNDILLNHIKGEYIRQRIVNDAGCDSTKYARELEYLHNYGAAIFPYEGMKKEFYCINDVKYDADGYPYLNYMDKKLFFRRDYTSDVIVKKMNELRNEQNDYSPHRYISHYVKVEEGDVVFDVGAAEGNFSLEIIDMVSHVYLFEYDDMWIEALNRTFAPYRDKVTIIKQLISDIDSENAITIDTVVNEYKIDGINLLKMDVEGYERNVLKGASNSIDSKLIKKLYVCIYHLPDDEMVITNCLKDKYNLELSEGYMCNQSIRDIWDFREPYFSRVLLRAKLKEE